MVSSFILFADVQYALSVLIFGYSAFWAYNIRRSLAVRAYRNQALGTGLVAASIEAAIIGGIQGNQYVISILTMVGILVVFYFIDTSTIVARRSDPLLRDILRWTKIRLGLWVTVAVLDVVAGLSLILLPISAQFDSFEGFLLFNSVGIVTLGVGVAALPIGALRSGDNTLRSHFKWFGTSLALLFLFIVPNALTPPINFLGGQEYSFFDIGDFEAAFAVLFLSGYCLYRSARSLAPLNRMALGEALT